MKSRSREAPEPFLQKHSRAIVIGALSIIILLTAVERVRFLNVPLERDEGEYAYAGQLILRGFPPYLHAYNMKFPGVYAAYALVMSVFGETIAGIRIGLLIVNVITIVLVFLVAGRLTEPLWALAAAASFALMSFGEPVLGSFAHATHFVMLFAVAGSLTLLKGVDNERAMWFLASGVLFGLAVLMKQHGVFFIVFAAAYTSWHEYRKRKGSLRVLLTKVTILMLGAAIPLVLTALLLWRAGVFGKFWFWTFKYAANYVSEMPLSTGARIFVDKVREIAGGSIALWLLAGTGLIVVWTRTQSRESRPFLVGLLLASFLAMVPGLYFRPHYFVLILPAVALLISSALSWMSAFLSKKRMHAASVVLPVSLFVIAIGSAAYQQSFFLFDVSPEQASRVVYGASAFPESVPVAEYIKSHSEPADQVAVLGSEPQIYFYSDRLSATGYIYMYGLMESHSYAEQMQQEMINEIEATRPKFVVQVFAPGSWVVRPFSAQLVFQWMKGFVKDNFDLVGVAEIVSSDKTNYYWDREAAAYARRSRDISDPLRQFPTVFVFRRKEAL
jgi:Dolichyl-phosphate-mannose-protein mannosyltransferase